jgi:multiple sugar transport system permease protein
MTNTRSGIGVRRRVRLFDVLIYSLFIVIISVWIGPIFWVISLSLKTSAEVLAYPPLLLPRSFAFENYLNVLRNSRIPLYLANSLKITFFTLIGNLLVTIPAAFTFSRFRFRGRRQILFSILLFQMVSHLIISIPLYRYAVMLKMLNSHTLLIVIYITTRIPFTVWLLKGFLDSLPIELDQAAIIDGCRDHQVLFLIILPLAMPGIAAVLVLNTVNAWGQFVIPYIFLVQDRLFPISVGILYYVQAQTEGVVTLHLLAAASVLAVLPALIIVTVLQKLVVQVLTAGAIKG